jgi:hypothetical protein
MKLIESAFVFFKMALQGEPRVLGQFTVPLSSPHHQLDDYSSQATSLAALVDLAQRMRQSPEAPSPFTPRWSCVSNPFPSLWRFDPPPQPTVTGFCARATVSKFEPQSAPSGPEETQPPGNSGPQQRSGGPDVGRSRRRKRKRRGQNQWVYKSSD